jgi:hypothetical protein
MKDVLDESFDKKLDELKGDEGEEEGLDLGGEEGEGGESGEEQGMYDKKEEEAREAVQEMFGELIEKIEGTRGAIEGLMNTTPELVAGKYRVKVEKDVMDKVQSMTALNENIQQANVYLKAYIDLGQELSPKFDNIKNLIFKFQEKLMMEQGRRFAILRAQNRGEYFITKGLIDYYLKGVHVHLSRIIGDLEAVGDYIVTVPPKREQPMGMEGDMGAGGDGAGFSPYVNQDRWWDRSRDNPTYTPGSRITQGKVREFGDKDTR